MGNGRHVAFMDGNVSVHHPSIPSGPQSLREDQSGTSRDHASSTMVAETYLVARFTRIEHGAPTGAHSLGKTADATQVGCIPQESTGTLASRLETFTEGVRSAGFLKDIAERVAHGKL